jgi:hypothetical protein
MQLTSLIVRILFRLVQKQISHFFVINPTMRTKSTSLFCHETLHVSESSSVRFQDFIHCTVTNGICHTGL